MFKQIFGHNKIWGILHPNAHPWLLGPGNVCGGCWPEKKFKSIFSQKSNDDRLWWSRLLGNFF